MEVDHYNILGLPSGEEGAILTKKEIAKAYREKARDLHPDKRKDDPNAHENFIKLKYSYEILVDDKARKLFDDLLHAKREQQHRFTQQDSKRRKMMSDLEDREHASFSPDPTVTAKEEEERIAMKLKEEIARIRAMHTNKGSSTGMGTCSGLNQGKTRVCATVELDKEKVLKVSWEIVGEGYTAEKLTQLFSRFGEVEDIVIRSSKKRGSALVVMSTKEAAAAATGSALGSALLVMPLKPATQKTQVSIDSANFLAENSTKIIQAITWHRSTLSKPQSCKSLVASSSKGSSAWSEYKTDLFDQYGGMDSGSHSSTLGRLYAWEKKLYEEVKAGDSTRKIYERKCSRLRNQDVKGYDELAMDKTRASVKDLYARILIAIRSAESISKRIQKIRDEELLPQIIELLKGLTRTWKVMLESHETQNKILSEVKSFACPSFGKFCNNSYRLATLQLEAELQNWRACFIEYVAAQRAYIQALHGWLTKFLVPEVEFYSRGRSSSAPYGGNGPPLLVICYHWLNSMEELPDNAVTFSLKSFSKDVKAMWAQQGEEQQQKRKVDGMAKEFDRRTMAFQKAQTRFLESNLLTEFKSEQETEQHNEYLMEKKDQLDMMRTRLDVEREKHHNYMQETQRITLSGFQTGFSTVFESLIEFSKASTKIYNDLVTLSENAGNMSYIEGSKVEENGSR